MSGRAMKGLSLHIERLRRETGMSEEKAWAFCYGASCASPSRITSAAVRTAVDRAIADKRALEAAS